LHWIECVGDSQIKIKDKKMEERKITLLEPIASTASKQIPLSRRLASLNNKTIGILWNTKPNGDILLRRIHELLSEKYKINGVIWRQKVLSDRPATQEIKELALSADLIINGQGD
jgi:hypothetical protein